MPIKDPKRRNELRRKRGETKYKSKAEDPEGHRKRMERQRLRRKVDKMGVDRSGKDVGHKKALAKGGSNSDGWRLESRSENRAKGGAMSKPNTKKK